MTYKSLLFKTLIFVFSLLSVSLTAQEVDIAAGKTLFKNQCASCHNKNMVADMTGPALSGVEERWADYPREDLYEWIRNSAGMIQAGHPRAVELWDTWKPTAMNPFPTLTDAEIENVLAYIDDVVNKAPEILTTGGPGGTVEKEDNTLLYTTLFIILALLALVLTRIVSNLNYLAQSQDGTAPARRDSIWDTLRSKGVIGFVLFALIIAGGYTTVNNAINLGRQQGYQPDQPIKFSHATHAGMQGIDCQYCHDGARRSKHSIIPAANTCMNCHKAIEKGSKYGTAELTKIFASIGYDPSTDKYIPNYEELPREEIEKIYSKWIADQAIADGATSNEAEDMVEEQWEGIVSALTSDDDYNSDDKIAGPIEWTRIHNLPDHVYFNHAQHVSVGKINCQQCHGKVEEMEVVGQYAPLSMGWCVNCHRQTEVQFADNEYYDTYKIYHEQIANGERDKVTVEEIGGLECQKCHY